MSATLIALALFGCSDDGKVCERLSGRVETYQTRGQCFGQIDNALESDAAMRADAPTVYAQCLSTRQLSLLGKGQVDLTRINGTQFAAAN